MTDNRIATQKKEFRNKKKKNNLRIKLITSFDFEQKNGTLFKLKFIFSFSFF